MKKTSQTPAEQGSRTSDMSPPPTQSTSHVPTTFVVDNPITVHQLNLQPALLEEQGCSVDQGDILQIKEESGDTEVDIGPTTFQHMDSYYRTNQVTSVPKQESAINNNNVNATLCSGVQQELLGKTCFPSFSYVTPVAPLLNTSGVGGQQCAQAISTPAGAGIVNEATGGPLPGIKVDVANLVLGPPVLDLQDMVPATHQEHLNDHHGQVSASKYGTKSNCHDQQSASTCGKTKIYICDYCRKTYINRKSFEAHVLYTHANGSFKCDQCGKSYRCKRYLLTHKIHMHTAHNMNECNVCATSQNPTSLRRHMRNMHSDEQLQCKLCGVTVKSKYNYRQHMNGHIGRPSALKYGTKFNFHGQQSAGTCGEKKIYICDYCQKTFTNRVSIKAHVLYMHAKRSFKCDQCGNSYKCMKYLLTHKIHMHSACIMKCNVCGTSLKPISVSYHMRYMHSDEQLQCKLCGETVKSKYNFRQHMKGHHQQFAGIDEASHFLNRCEFCGKIYSTKEYLKTHIRSVHGNPTHRCKCNMVFISKANLQRHMELVHSKEEHDEHNQQSTYTKFEEKSSETTDPTVSAVNAAASARTQQQDVVVVKEEQADEELELGPVVLQHMDCNYQPYKREPLLE